MTSLTKCTSYIPTSTSSQALLPRAKQLVTKRILNDLKSVQSVARTKQLHAHVTISGLTSSRLSSNLSRSYALCGHVDYARQLFDGLADRSTVLRSCLMRMYAQKGLHREALRLFSDMVADGNPKPDDYIYPFALKACGDAGLLRSGAAVHGRALVAGFASDAFVQNCLLAMYVNFKDIKSATIVFEAIPDKGSVVSWNTMIAGLFRNGRAEEAVRFFWRMVSLGLEPDTATAVAVLPACGSTRDLALGKKIHALVEQRALREKKKNIKAYNALLDMYARCGHIGGAHEVFDGMGLPDRDVVAWTTLINGYIINKDERAALRLFKSMQFHGVQPNSVTLSLVLSACASLSDPNLGASLHCTTLKLRLENDVVIETALIDMYSKCGLVDQSLRVFDRCCSGRKSAAPWSAAIAGCTQNGLAREAVGLFKRMMRAGEPRPVDTTLSGVLNSYTILADFRQSMSIHCHLIKTGIVSNAEVSTGLVNAYSKCGSSENARRVFDEIPKSDWDVIMWTTMIACYARHGMGEAAVSVFDQMVDSGVGPNEVTLTSVLHACSHAGLVDQGLRLFRLMESPAPDHYTCAVDLLGRAGRVEEAYGVIKSMTFEPNSAVWGALLGACVLYQNVEVGEIAAKRLFEIEPQNTGNYVLMAKIYSAVGRWNDAESVRRAMGEIGLRKSPAHSYIGVRNM